MRDEERQVLRRTAGFGAQKRRKCPSGVQEKGEGFPRLFLTQRRRAARLGMEWVFENELVATGQGPESVCGGFSSHGRGGRRGANRIRRADGSEPGDDRGGRGCRKTSSVVTSILPGGPGGRLTDSCDRNM